MKHDSFKTYLHWGLTAFGVVALSILFFFSLFKVGALVHFFQTLTGILMPFVYGLAMAYLLTPVFNWLHARFAPALQKHVKNPRRAARAAKFLSTTLSVLLALLLVAALLWMVLPQVISSIVGLVESNLLTNSIQNVTGWIEDTLQNNPQFEAAAQRVYAEAVAALTAWVKTDMLPQLTNLMSGLLGTLTFFKNVFIGIIIAIYVLNSKQLFAAQAKKLLYGCLSTRRANIVLDNARFTHRVFGGFINGKLLDSLIIGILCRDDSAAHAVCDAHQRGGGRNEHHPVFRAVYRCHSQRAAYPSHRPAQGALLRAFYPCAAAIRRQYPGPKNSGRFHRPFQLLGDVRHSAGRRAVRVCRHGRRRAAVCGAVQHPLRAGVPFAAPQGHAGGNTGLL